MNRPTTLLIIRVLEDLVAKLGPEGLRSGSFLLLALCIICKQWLQYAAFAGKVTHVLGVVIDILQIAGQVDFVATEELGALEDFPEEDDCDADEDHSV